MKTITKKHGINGWSRMAKGKLVEALCNMEEEILKEPVPEIIEHKCQHGKVKYISKDC